MEDDCEIVCEVEKTVKSPEVKKLKQSRLPFARLDSKTPHKLSSPPTPKKRKLSGSGVSGSSAKAVRSDGRRGVPKKRQKTQKAGRKQVGLRVAHRKEDKPVRKRKRGRLPLKEKGSCAQEDNKKLSKSSHRLMSDDEVSSSVDDETDAPKAKKKSVEKIRKLLPLLLCKEPTQQAEISTSTEDVSDREEKENLEEAGEKEKITFNEYVRQTRDCASVSEEIEIHGRKEEENGGTDKESDKESEVVGKKEEENGEKDKESDVIIIEDLKKDSLRADGAEENKDNKAELNSRQEKARKGDRKKASKGDSRKARKGKSIKAGKGESKKAGKGESKIAGKGENKKARKGSSKITSCEKGELVKGNDVEEAKKTVEEIETNDESGCNENGDQKVEKEENKVDDDRSEAMKGKGTEKEESKLEYNEADNPEEEEKAEKEIDLEKKEIEDLQESGKVVKMIEETDTNTQEQEEEDNIEGNKSTAQEEESKATGKRRDSVGRKKGQSCGVRKKNAKEVKGKITNYLNVVKKLTKEGDENGAMKNGEDRGTEIEGKVVEVEEETVKDVVDESIEMSEKEAVDVNTKNDEESVGMTSTEDEGPVETKKTMVDSDDVDPKTSLPSCPGSNATAHVGPKKITAMQKKKMKKQLEMREKLNQERKRKKLEVLAEKEKRRKEREEQRQKQKEEKERIKEDMKRKRQEELDAKRQKKEEDMQRKEEEKRVKDEEKRLKDEEKKQKDEEKKQKDEEKRQKEEEKRQKEEEKRLKEEAKKQAEEEKQRQKDKLKKRFASFFVAKKRDLAEMEEESDNGVFKQFRVKEDMQMAPITRCCLSEDQRSELDGYISGNAMSSKLYLNILKSGNYLKQKSERTWPPEDKKGDVDDVEIIEEEEDMGNMDGMIEDTAAGVLKGKLLRAKFLLFCENRRPAYRGTWSKISSSVSARKPFAKHDTIDYEYDSDDDWEEEEAGESLSDSEGEEKEEEDGDQYEVDNEFFVPHAYLSDDEGRSDEEGAADDKLPTDDPTRHKEKLKEKQAEFEEEMKKKTKQLKPRILGCLWMADANNNPARIQLLKILNSYKVVTLCSELPIGINCGGSQPQENNDRKLEEEGASEDKSNVKQKFVKTFPEEAVPPLVQLLHGNRHGKIFLSREFSDYWRKERGMEGKCFIAKKKVEAKIQELGRWRKCPDEGPLHKVMMWYVPEEVREKHGIGELTLPNAWDYINKPKERREISLEDADDGEEGSKTGKLIPITAFAKKSTASSLTDAPPQKGETPKLGSPASSPSNSGNSYITSSPITKVSSGKSISTPGQQRKKVALISVARGHDITSAQQASFASFFKKSGDTPPKSSVDKKSGDASPKSPADSEKKEKKSINKEEVECMIID